MHKPKLLVSLAVAFLSLAALSRINAQPLSIITGVLQTETGQPVDAVIRAARVRTPPARPGLGPAAPLTPQFVNVTTKAGSGAFTFTGLPAGMYELCVTVPDGGFVDPCLWEKSGVMVNVPDQQVVSGVVIAIKKASTLRVRVEDPSHLIRHSPAGTVVMAVVAPGGRFYPLIFGQQDDPPPHDVPPRLPEPAPDAKIAHTKRTQEPPCFQ